MAETRAELYAKWTTEDVKRFRAENAQLQRDLAAARAEAARLKAAVAEALRRGMAHAGFDRHMLAGEEPWVQEIAAKLTEPSQ